MQNRKGPTAEDSNAGKICRSRFPFGSANVAFDHRQPKKRAREGPVSVSQQACQEDRYEDRVSPRRSASRYWVRSRGLILALATLSR